MWNFASVEADFLGCHVQFCVRSAGWQQLLVLQWQQLLELWLLCAALLHTGNQSLKGTQHCPQFSHPCGRPTPCKGWQVQWNVSVMEVMYIPEEQGFSLSTNSRAPISDKHYDQTLLCSGESVFKILWKWVPWKLIIVMLTALWAFACYWNDFTKRSSNEGWIGGEDKLFPSHFPNDRPAAM